MKPLLAYDILKPSINRLEQGWKIESNFRPGQATCYKILHFSDYARLHTTTYLSKGVVSLERLFSTCSLCSLKGLHSGRLCSLHRYEIFRLQENYRSSFRNLWPFAKFVIFLHEYTFWGRYKQELLSTKSKGSANILAQK